MMKIIFVFSYTNFNFPIIRQFESFRTVKESQKEGVPKCHTTQFALICSELKGIYRPKFSVALLNAQLKDVHLNYYSCQNNIDRSILNKQNVI